MKEQILEIAKDLEQGIITEVEAQNLLLNLFGVISSVVDENEDKEIKFTFPIIRRQLMKHNITL